MFLPNDLYLASGTAQLINNWVDPVYKFDSSSFYNWEQDNLPIYDLEDRDDYLFEMAGYPTSAVDGVMLTVSDTGVDNKKVFGTIADAVDALPNTIRFPIIIEVCTSGALGGMHLEHKEFEGSGAGLEIINRAFAKVICGSGTAPSSTIEAVGTNSSSITQFSSVEVSNTMYETCSLGVSAKVWNNNAESSNWWNNYTRAFVQYPEWGNAANTSERTVTISSKFSDTAGNLCDAIANSFNATVYEDNSVSSGIVITRESDDENIQRNAIVDAGGDTARTTGFIYANSLSGVSVKGCSGKIFIRGFCVDGASQAAITSEGSQTTDLGFDIQNSEVVIENCTAARCKSAGLRAVESDVTLNRGFIAFHNYELETGTGGSNLDTKVESNPTPGLCAINSNITLSASTEADKGLPIDSPFNFYRNMVGIELKNSTLMTPTNTKYGTNIAGVTVTPQFGSQTIALQACFNIREGISAKNSLIETGQRIASFQNNVGLKLDTSICKVAEITLDHNAEAGLKSVNSELTYNKDTYTPHSNGPWYPVTNFQANGQHILLTGSQFVPAYADDMPAKYSRFTLSGNFAVATRTIGGSNFMSTLPGVEVDSNSYMNAVCVKCIMLTDALDTTAYQQDNAIKGSAFRVTNSSKLDLYGTGANSTWVIGPVSWSKQQQNAALYAGNSSHISIAGPTTICQFGVDALAEDNSTIEIGPHQKNGVLDASSWALSAGADPSNHTQVQLHATRACLVANKNSVLNLHDLGDYHKYWDSKYIGNGSVNTPDYPTGNTQLAYNTSAFTASGWCQFLPNPYVNYDTYDGLLAQAGYPTAVLDVENTSTKSLYPTGLFPLNNDVSNASFGGMCVRAVDDSQVNVKNVLFPAGWANPSGPYYDFSSTPCDLLRIWNIADNSELHASYLSVGSDSYTGAPAYPQDVSSYYYGPSAMWVSDTGTGLSGAPSSTVDTSNASVLDSFGLGVQTGGDLGYYGKTTQQNIGPFRIYVSPDPKAKFLGYPSGTTGVYPGGGVPNVDSFNSMGFGFDSDATLVKGAPYQLFAQGYATSSDCSAINNQGPNYTNASAIYQDLGFSGYITSLPADQQTLNCASSFFYVSAMIPGNPRARIWLDESAMNTFANAKNGTLGTSGRKKIFSYYKAITEYPGEAFVDADVGSGIGFGTANLFDLDREL